MSPAVSEKQRRFMGAVMAAKKGKKGVSSKAREAASGMSEESIKDFLHKKSAAYQQGFLDKLAAEDVTLANWLRGRRDWLRGGNVPIGSKKVLPAKE